MGRKKKPFIDKKHATTYRLVHRSQHDPLIADDNANQMVLNEVYSANQTIPDERLKMQREYGIYYEDDYDYMQHVRDRSEGEGVVWEAVNPTAPGRVVLPISVFASAEEEPIGMLNLAAPRGLDLSLDPDIVAALDDDFDFDDPNLELEDDFINLAEGGALENISEEDYDSEECNDDVDSMFSNDDLEEERTRFTEYSVSSSVLPRNEGLTLLDDKFEEMFKEYDELGAGEEELKPVDEVYGTEPNLILEQLCREFEKQDLSDEESGAMLKTKTLTLAARHSEKSEKKIDVTEDVEERAAVQWDCETILSTYTNIYNHPKLINIPPRIRLNKKGIVIEEEAEEHADEGVSVSSDEEDTIVISNLRTKSETPEERRARKKAVKESQKLRRQIKKATKEVFKDENCREQRVNANKSGKTIKL